MRSESGSAVFLKNLIFLISEWLGGRFEDTSFAKERVWLSQKSDFLRSQGFEDASYNLRAVRRWCQYMRQGREGLHTNHDQADFRSIFSTSRSWPASKRNRFLRGIHLLRFCASHIRQFESFAWLTGNENLLFALDTPWVDREVARNQIKNLVSCSQC
jgi:hypothetical protein